MKRGGCTECDDIKNKILSHREPMNRRTRSNYLQREPLKVNLPTLLPHGSADRQHNWARNEDVLSTFSITLS